jgi:ribosomal protein S18 acetylase RimI-like enzyme
MPVEAKFSLKLLGVAEATSYQELRLEGLLRHPELFRVAYEDERALPLDTVAERLSASYTLGAFMETKLVGIGSLAPVAGTKLRHKALLYGMYVRREVGGSGLGEAIIRAILSHERSCYDSVQLTVAANNARARSLYERCGFRWYATEPRSIKVAQEYLDEALLWLPLQNEYSAKPRAGW